MLHGTPVRRASLRYRRPYWMMFLKGVDNWKIYTVIQQPDHQRTEMLYQAWLGGLDRPYTRPKCMANQPLWLSKKRHMLRKERLDGPETPLEKYVLEWHKKFHSFQGTERPTPDDLHTALDLVERPLDLSYALQLLGQCRNLNNIRFAKETFLVFLEACLRVGRRDCAEYALEHAEPLGFWFIDEDHRRYLQGEQTWYKLSPLDNLYYPVEENAKLNEGRKPITRLSPATESPGSGTAISDGEPSTDVEGETTVDDEIAQLEAELAALEREGGGK
ncbi:hypothetical protein, conserved [Trypanosoma brucei gambiense DAL972]|uniref:Uncharacterized protein n=1 Tax=Trypanosoma brucei gambiense (strain MHOM/CI/86/DAL972) TaxID=679716 RepID=C9ZXR0_TRYB9|nr:hypothetical protein, conserved [Trypanosoma brucei gambiense DAL972]6HIV_DP Chain DP, ms63 [Trypanosoma brucei brucei]6HIW_DP Chain DP, mS63 [Trypanosoma brucei brucei]6HIY_DP Chain DP, mS63 [Trypanosoma brucei brucei]6SGA_DP Chain DP, mS63 (KRIPP16) [Trypanosoma brucei brucei]6SGB_DP Chain DP, mS63 (KRIPP16) [Trypanosoma brucei brucei]7PUA_DP Chain DP, mS63 [Trypanosoma brucei brucei]7PUB_DP Chain DP, mS63 [Trypanosoma brucei brucei]CBH14205.1 hypothetical protein, conserved [Trypanoso|eukprot:XP_011776475.1 hypothetical protein, conserved [Trypanosoma brucei gambiense DAL972]